MALLGDRMGLGGSDGFGITQGLATLLGAGLLAAGWAGSRIPALYRGTALILLNTIVLLAVVEIGAALVLKTIDPTAISSGPEARPTRSSAYYRSKSWAEPFWEEFDRAATHSYYPFQMWRMRPFEGRFIRVGRDGLRATPGADCVAGAYNVDVFGGSTVWGLGVPDWGTVPAYLQASLHQSLRRPVCVRNFGQLGSNSTQDLIALLRELQQGRVPDLVIFLSGANEIITAFEVGQAGVHGQLNTIAARIEGLRFDRGSETPEESPARGWLNRLNTYRLFSHIVSAGTQDAPLRFRYEGAGHESDTLAQSIVRVWLQNYRMVEALGREYRFAHEFFWQPNVLVGRKPLTAEEKPLRIGERLAPLVELVDRRLRLIAFTDYQALHNLTDVFADDSSLLYLDWHHLTLEGNALVAAAIVERLVAQTPVREKSTPRGKGS